MKQRSLVAVASLFLVGTAAADFTPPTGWQSNPDFAAALSSRNDVFGGVPSTVTTEVYRAPIQGAILYVTRAEAKVTAEQRDAAASYEIDELRRTLERAGASAKPQAQSQRVDPAAKLVEGTLSWRDDAAELVSSRRVAIAADANRLVAITGECVLATGLPPDVANACEQALLTVVPDIAPAQRVAISLVGAAATAAPVAPVAEPPVGSGAPSSTGPSMGDGSKLPPIPPIAMPQKPPKRESDRRPVILGIGLVVLALVFYFNRKRRDRFDREDARAASQTAGDEPASDDAPSAKRGGNGTSDHDMDDDEDLHAAADEREPSSSDAQKKKGDDDTN